MALIGGREHDASSTARRALMPRPIRSPSTTETKIQRPATVSTVVMVFYPISDDGPVIWRQELCSL